MNDKTRNSRFTRKTRRQDQTIDKTPNSSKSGQNNSPKRAYASKTHGATARPKSPRARNQQNSSNNRPKSGQESQSRRSGKGHEGGSGWIWGTHACMAALANPKRTIHDIIMTEAANTRLTLPEGAAIARIVLPQTLDKTVPRGVVHQGIAIKAAPLEWKALEDIADEASKNALILVLDQITDPHNVGAMLRLASAFGVSAVVMQTRKAPPLSGALAKVAVGCLETVPVCLETNIANTLINLQRIGWMVTGLAGETDLSLSQALQGGGKRVIVMGAEGPGLRERVRKNCDQLAKIPMMSTNALGQAESLNVATAAGIALYEARRD
ncbi:MAG: RNA methyltransferase [Litorimonas sp.]